MLALAFLDSLALQPIALHKDAAARGFEQLEQRLGVGDAAAEGMRQLKNHPNGRALLAALFEHSPFLTRLVLQYPDFFIEICTSGPGQACAGLMASVTSEKSDFQAELMRRLRGQKSRMALLTAIADISGAWGLAEVTAKLSAMAESCIRAALDFLLREAARKGDIMLPDAGHPSEGCGFFVLALGKLGAFELNYSSDIDLIVFFDRERVRWQSEQDMQQYFSKLTRELVRMLQERTGDGYVFRVDLRLRPDPGSTPLALSTAGALTYYETVGQNWERAALIKARAVAGDIEAGERFLKQIAPFLWRRHLDFAAIEDIQSIKRQMDAQKGQSIDLPGHNIKTGLGGIREIEFFAQIHQLIWGGRIPSVRTRGTCETLAALSAAKLIPQELTAKLTESYGFFRTVEHRLQMVDDQQTHTLPATTEGRATLAAFTGMDAAAFDKTLLTHLRFVHKNFSESFRGGRSLADEEGKLSFTGVENDPQTLGTLTKMGYDNPAAVSEAIQQWHHGKRRATRTKRARELITELTPTLLKAFAGAAHPSQAFLDFDKFLSGLPAGVQLFSLFQANPHLLDLIALIIGSAPAMAESLGKHPALLDTVLTSDFFRELPQFPALLEELSALLQASRNFEDEMDIIRRFKNEKQFQAGVQLIRGQVPAAEASRYLSDIAGACLQVQLQRLEAELKGQIPGISADALTVIALGRLGARELTFGSDIDLVFVYDAPQSKHAAYNKLSQRFIGTLTTLTREGRLYEVDTRLRPSGMDGALCVSLAAFDKYFHESAWTFEFMALTRARTVTGNAKFQKKLHEVIHRHLAGSRDAARIAQDVLSLRAKVEKEFGSKNPWDLKYARGGLMELDFLAQYFALVHAAKVPEVLQASSGKVFEALALHALFDPQACRELEEAHHFLNSLFALVRLCGGGVIDEHAAPQGLKHLLASRLGLETFAQVKERLLSTLALVHRHFEAVLGPSQPA